MTMPMKSTEEVRERGMRLSEAWKGETSAICPIVRHDKKYRQQKAGRNKMNAHQY